MFSRFVRTREREVQGVGTWASLEALERHAEVTEGALLHFNLEAAGHIDAGADYAARHGTARGKSLELCRNLRGTAPQLQAQHVCSPVDLCGRHDIEREALCEGEVSDGFREVVWEVASQAKLHLDEARRLAPELPAAARSLFLPAVPAFLYSPMILLVLFT